MEADSIFPPFFFERDGQKKGPQKGNIGCAAYRTDLARPVGIFILLLWI